MRATRRALLFAIPAGAASALSVPANAASAAGINRDAGAALQRLTSTEVKARQLYARAKAVLIFPKIVKAGLLVGGQSGDGVLRVGGRPRGYYNISAVSYGLQIGAQSFSYVMFFMTDSALGYLNASDGWQLGAGPTVVAVDKGAATGISTTTATQDVYAFTFGQSGLMAGLGVEGSKITRITPDA